ncbi:MAG: methyltransferase family protein [Firmicutes bacterium]|nr:methyltransferase family protein [Bacillota bacterium]
MHISSYIKMDNFKKKYLSNFKNKPLKILDVGSQDVNGTYRPIFEDMGWQYIGCDMAAGKNVDVVLKDVYNWNEFESGSFDVVISGQVFEHIEYMWLTMLEIARVLKEAGLCCVIAPSAGNEHRYPVDCWRIYPDGFKALAMFSCLETLEVYTEWGNVQYLDDSGIWHDSVLIAQKPNFSKEKKDLFESKSMMAKLMAANGLFK